MIGLGTIFNVGAIVVGGFFGVFFGKFLTARYQEILITACGLFTTFMSVGGVMEKMLTISDGTLSSGYTMMMIFSFTFGAILGEWIDLDTKMKQFGEWLKQKTGNNGDSTFVTAFVTASLTVCIGAMAIVGSIQDGILGDPSTLITKGIIDFVIITTMSASLGRGCAFSAIPVGICQGTMTLLARLIEPILNDSAMWNISLTGNILIFCVGINLLRDRKIKVANLLPVLLFAVIWTYLPFGN